MSQIFKKYKLIRLCTHDCEWQKKDQVGEKLQTDHHYHLPKGFFPQFVMVFQGEATIGVPITISLNKSKHFTRATYFDTNNS